jgi:hypothetical protein
MLLPVSQQTDGCQGAWARVCLPEGSFCIEYGLLHCWFCRIFWFADRTMPCLDCLQSDTEETLNSLGTLSPTRFSNGHGKSATYCFDLCWHTFNFPQQWYGPSGPGCFYNKADGQSISFRAMAIEKWWVCSLLCFPHSRSIFEVFLPVVSMSLLVWILACVLLPSHVIAFSSIFHLFCCLTLIPFVRPQVCLGIVPSFHELSFVFTIDEGASDSVATTVVAQFQQ